MSDGRKTTSLKKLTALTATKVRENSGETPLRIFDAVHRAAASITGTMSTETNIRRRVYDILNVFEACGIVEKRDNRIFWIGSEGLLHAEGYKKTTPVMVPSYIQKETELLRKINKIVQIHNLIARNYNQRPPENPIYSSTLFFEFEGRPEFTHSQNNHTVTIILPPGERGEIYSFYDIIDMMEELKEIPNEISDIDVRLTDILRYIKEDGESSDRPSQSNQ